jgi:hypothetical protein
MNDEIRILFVDDDKEDHILTREMVGDITHGRFTLMKTGAADYPIKGQVNASILERSVRFTLERKVLQRTLVEAQQREQRERKLRELAHLHRFDYPAMLRRDVWQDAPWPDATQDARLDAQQRHPRVCH